MTRNLQESPELFTLRDSTATRSFCTSQHMFFDSSVDIRRKLVHSLTTEIDAAAREWIRSTQQTNYPDISRFLQNNTSEKPNLVRELDLYMDEKNLIRCRGRIHNAPLDVDAKFPYLLPPKDRLTVLIIEHAHVTHLHSGLESTVTFFRRKIWIPNIRQRVRFAIHRCPIS